jgi:NADPH2:quinone reductase
MARRHFQMLAEGIITAGHSHAYALEDAAQAHADLEARKTSGAVILEV